MELVAGPTLAGRDAPVADAPPARSRCRSCVAILIQLCDALDHAHNLRDEHGRPLGLIHRDVSPANIIISTPAGPRS